MAQESRTISPASWQRPWGTTEGPGPSDERPTPSARVSAFEDSLPLLFPGAGFLALGLYLLLARIPLYAGHEPLAILLTGVGVILLLGGVISWRLVGAPATFAPAAEVPPAATAPAAVPAPPEPWVEEPGSPTVAARPPAPAPVAPVPVAALGPDPIEELLASIDVLHQASSDPDSPGALRWRTPDFSGAADREPETGGTTGRVARCVACRRRLTESEPARCQSCELDMCASCARAARDEGRAGFCPTCAMLLEGSNEV